MKNLYDPAAVEEIRSRIERLRPESPRLWGKMNSAQMLAHCARSMEWAVGETIAQPAPLPLRILGRAIKPLALGDDKPFRRNSPTAKELIVPDRPDYEAEKARLIRLIGSFAEAGPAGCTTHAHAFFGRLAPDEWAILTYKHLDHHLRQFSV